LPPNAHAFGGNAGYDSRIHRLALVNSAANFEKELVNLFALTKKRVCQREHLSGRIVRVGGQFCRHSLHGSQMQAHL
jgi:hypothetical protein